MCSKVDLKIGKSISTIIIITRHLCQFWRIQALHYTYVIILVHMYMWEVHRRRMDGK